MQNLAKHRLALLALAIMLAPTLTSAQTLSGESSGTLDITFGTGGLVTTNFNGTDFGRAIAVQSDGKIVVAGSAFEVSIDFALARYNRDGTLDASFGTGGKVHTDFVANSNDQAVSVVIQADGKIVAAGLATINGNSDFALARYNRDGTLDATFGAGGRVTTDFAGANDQALSVAIQAEGKIVAAGVATISGGFDFALASYNPDGTLDATFGAGGTVTTDFAGATDQAFSVAVQKDGKIVAAGAAVINGISDFALARYTSNGTLDATFGTGGTVTTDFAGGVDTARSVALQSDGKIVAAGLANINGNVDFALARYTSDGTLDATFGAGGTVTTDFAGGADQAFAVALQRDGKIVAAGRAIISGSFNFALARYSSDGTLDAGFGTGGTVTTDFAGGGPQAFAVAVQRDGKIVAAGQSVILGSLDFALARYE